MESSLFSRAFNMLQGSTADIEIRLGLIYEALMTDDCPEWLFHVVINLPRDEVAFLPLSVPVLPQKIGPAVYSRLFSQSDRGALQRYALAVINDSRLPAEALSNASVLSGGAEVLKFYEDLVKDGSLDQKLLELFQSDTGKENLPVLWVRRLFPSSVLAKEEI